VRNVIALAAFICAVGSAAGAQTLPTADQILDRAAAAVGAAPGNYRYFTPNAAGNADMKSTAPSDR
jgi:hypothetical protein